MIQMIAETNQIASSMKRRIFLSLILFRVFNSFLIKSFFNPDEFWQGQEVAHYITFGIGDLTWEWKSPYKIRGFLHPLLISSLYWLLSFLNIDNEITISIGPKVLQSFFAAICDYCTFDLAIQFSGISVAYYVLMLQTSSWFNFYSLCRPYSNSLESSLVILSLDLWYPVLCVSMKDSMEKQGREIGALVVAALCTAIRPTSAIIWMFVGLFRLYHMQGIYERFFFSRSVIMPVVGSIFILNILLDSWMYGEWVFVPYNFFKFNILQETNAFFGKKAWHWLFTQGFPAVLGLSFPLFLFSVFIKRTRGLFWLSIIYTSFHSISTHKEFRFLLPVVPLAHICTGLSFCQIIGSKRLRIVIMTLIAIIHLSFGYYMNTFHQRGPLAVLENLRDELREKNALSSILFFLPCHGTPYYSFLHFPKAYPTLRFLDCSIDSTQPTETEMLLINPNALITSIFWESGLPDFIVSFPSDSLSVSAILDDNGYVLYSDIFYTHFQGDRDSTRSDRRIFLYKLMTRCCKFFPINNFDQECQQS